ncbi:phosphomevalonate kinase [Weissella uvarum]|uniref:phosphomevalonate kinase n=1 Tax=Weissella uvarum TaxID=1479233 RepID=UPI00196145DA|nr:phosphomevalonate kinase [Weissella uvarum]MBM7617463.1 phosphomevalonate kinase [Weissella uvarum]MCM0595652.1 phosphomevalonate kinase [Weissella uvarum]
MKTVAKAPGKLFLAGEYAVTIPGHASIIFAIDRFMTVTVSDIDEPVLDLNSDKLGGLMVKLDDLDHLSAQGEWQLVIETLKWVKRRLQADNLTLNGLQISFKSDLDIDGKKIGLGSSAALVVALVNALVKHYHLPENPMHIFKLAAIIMTSLPDFKRGSMGDVAAASFGGIIFYERFDNLWLEKHLLQPDFNLMVLLELPWPKLVVRPIVFPENWQLLVGWTGEPADTQKQLSVNQRTAIIYKERLGNKTTPLIKLLEQNIKAADYIGFRTNLHLNQVALVKFADVMHLKYMTPKLRALLTVAHHHGIAAKISGAGNGDNGLAVIRNEAERVMMASKWEALKITPLDVHIAKSRLEGID